MDSRGKQDTSKALLDRPRVAELAANGYTDTQVGLMALLQFYYLQVKEGRCRKVKS